MKKAIILGGTFLCFVLFGLGLDQKAGAQDCLNLTIPVTLTQDTVICSGIHTVNVGPDPTPDQDPKQTPVVTVGADDITITCEEGAILDGIDGEGYGIYGDGHSNVTITGCEIRNYHDGMFFINVPANVHLHHNYLHDNQASGIELSGIIGTPPASTGFRVEYNQAVDNTLSGEGINIHVSWSQDAVISHNILSSDTADADDNRVGIHYDGSVGGYIQHNTGGVMGIAIGTQSSGVNISYNVVRGSDLSDLQAFVGCGPIHDVILEYNIIHDGINGMNWAEDNYGIIVRNNIFYNLSGNVEGAARLECTVGDCSSPHVFANNIVYNSNLALNIGPNVIAKNNLIIGNQTGIRSSSGEGTISYNDVWNNTTDYQWITAGTGDISVDPLFVDPADPDGLDSAFWTSDDGFRVLAGSPAIDAGDPADDYSREPDYPHGRINLGAYGNTELATAGLNCLTPTPGMEIKENITLCAGGDEYVLDLLIGARSGRGRMAELNSVLVFARGGSTFGGK